MTQEEYNSMLASAREQFKQGTPLFGKEGAFHRILEDFLNCALEGEMESHLSVTKAQTKNRRNGKMCKTLQTKYGQVEIETPRDHDGSFSPEIVQKRQTILAKRIVRQDNRSLCHRSKHVGHPVIPSGELRH